SGKKAYLCTRFPKGTPPERVTVGGGGGKIFRKIWRNEKNALTLQTLSLKNGSKIFDMIWIQETQYEK
ncbi:hypothetical protein, partial [Bacteroides gallinaceum]|uniref:hypothetical protein n=1 Tax=Bacteroides gallinaceum TaxID=1462571 RepID=UPI00195E6E93